jgi:23S rRNA (adenine2503-C2)-methyltransferase
MPAFRAKQILEWVYERGVADPAAMTNLSKRDRDLLAAEMVFLTGDIIAHQSATDGTQKLLIQWNDGRGSGASGGALVNPGGVSLPIAGEPLTGPVGDTSRQTECVMIPTDDRRTACISSQIGCPVGCRFCASGLGGLDGNLTAGRIVEQVWRLGRLPGVDRISNIVFMGMGEPLANLNNVCGAIRTLNGLWATGISARKITISTVGLPAAIERLAEMLDLPVTLALSLHAPTDEIRRSLIPWAEYTTIADLLAACRKWFEKTGREITLEYTLLHRVNDRPEHAAALARLAGSLRANVNLIRYNEVAGLPFGRPLDGDVLAFQALLRDRGVNVHIRASRGRDIAAACGQLRHEGDRSASSGAPNSIRVRHSPRLS